LAEHAGDELGITPWRCVDQPLVDSFAADTGDQQWIHVDPQRASQGPFGGTVAHGYLVLAMVPSLIDEVLCVQGASVVLNKEVRRARFLAPVPVGSRVRAAVSLTSARSRPRGFWEAEFLVAAEVEGITGAAVTAQQILLYQ
jgi:acyl dehydratase